MHSSVPTSGAAAYTHGPCCARQAYLVVAQLLKQQKRLGHEHVADQRTPLGQVCFRRAALRERQEDGAEAGAVGLLDALPVRGGKLPGNEGEKGKGDVKLVLRIDLQTTTAAPHKPRA